MNRVNSRYKIFGGFGLLILLNTIIGFGTYSLLIKSKISVDKVDLLNDSGAQLAYSIILGLQFLFLLIFTTQSRFITADKHGITFINPLFPFLRKTTRWMDFDYYITVEEHSRYDTYEAVWFIKDEKLAARFSSFYYTNYYDIKKQIETRKKGKKYFNPFAQLFILLGLKKVVIK